ncbi:MAG TPA: SpoIIE family protein phosphatase [Baekduia sp.]|nr:SpoIIE family protein phosphatase [Baekduia sp.]
MEPSSTDHLDADLPRIARRFDALLEANRMMVWVASTDGRLVSDIPGWRAITGQSPDELVGDGWLRAIHPDHRDRVADAWRRAVAGRELFEIEYPILASAGGMRLLAARGTPISEDDGSVREWVGVLTDITDQRAEEQARALLQDRLDDEQVTLNQVVAQSPVAVAVLWGPQHEFRFFNQRYLDLVPDGRVERGRTVAEALPEAAVAVPLLDRALAGETVEFNDLPIRFDDERSYEGYRFYDIVYAPIVRDGRPAGVSVTAQETTTQVRVRRDLQEELRRERGFAESLQHALLPEDLPDVPGLDLAVRYFPGRLDVGVGGDWYDTIRVSPHEVLLAVGDVAGRGLQAARIMGQMRAALRAYAVEAPSPARILARLSAFSDRLELSEMVTVGIGRLDLATGRLTYAGAGHLPPLVVLPGQEPSYLEVDIAPPIGAGFQDYHQRTSTLPPGGSLLMFTDGLVEERRRSLAETLEELRRGIAPTAGADAADLAQALVDRRMLDREPDDDIALLVCRNTGGGAPAPEPGGGRPAQRAEWRLPAVASSVALARAGVREFAAAHGAPDEAVGPMALAVSEAVTNAVIHAFIDREPGTLRVIAEAGPDEVAVRVVDDGRGLQPRPDSPGMGLGLPTIGQLTATLDMRRGPGGLGTEVAMTFAAQGVRGPARVVVDAAAREALLAEVGRAALGGAWPGDGVERLIEVVVPTAADACAVDVIDERGEPRRVAGRIAGGPDAERRSAWLAGLRPRLAGSATADAQAHRRPRIVELTPEHLERVLLSAGDVEELGATDLRWWVVAPMLVEDERLLGLLHFGFNARRGTPSEETMALLEAIAERAAGALANTQLIAELRNTRQRLERILGVLAEAITVHDAEGRTVYANEAAARLLGAGSVEELLSATADQIMARFDVRREDGSPVALEDLPGQRLLGGQPAAPLLTRSEDRATGRQQWLLTKATILKDDRGALAVNVIEDVTEAKGAERRQRFLARAGEVLGSTLDYEQTLQQVAELVVPDVADWCAVDVVGADGGLERLGLAHADAERLALARELARRYPRVEPHALAQRILAGDGPALLTEITDEQLEAHAVDADHLELLRGLGLRSMLVLPLRLGDRTLGLVTLVAAERRRRFEEDDVAFGVDLARRAAIAIENARLYEGRAAPGTGS